MVGAVTSPATRRAARTNHAPRCDLPGPGATSPARVPPPAAPLLGSPRLVGSATCWLTRLDCGQAEAQLFPESGQAVGAHGRAAELGVVAPAAAAEDTARHRYGADWLGAETRNEGPTPDEREHPAQTQETPAVAGGALWEQNPGIPAFPALWKAIDRQTNAMVALPDPTAGEPPSAASASIWPTRCGVRLASARWAATAL